MELSSGIKHILNGDAIILFGAGASDGATSVFGPFPSGKKLAGDLYSACGIDAEDIYDLQDASQTFEEMKGADALIQEIEARLSVASVSAYHSKVYGLPWRRYYTTNYDRVAEIAAKKIGVNILPVTLSSNFRKNCGKEHLCVHINGYIGNLNQDTLNNEFKLTATSYNSAENINNSDWGALLSDDIDAAKCIVVLGLSLSYDLDLSRVLFGEENKEKTLIINSVDLSADGERKLSRFGAVYKIGLSGFADEIDRVSQSFIPTIVKPYDKLYTCFEHEFHRPPTFQKPYPSDVFNLFFSGKCSNTLFHKTHGNYEGFVFRSACTKIHESISVGRKFTIIHSDMGNGKTACLHEVRNWVSRKDYHIFSLTDINISCLQFEISDICSIELPCIVVIDNYPSYMDVLASFSRKNINNIQFLLSARTAINYSKVQDLFKMFAVQENQCSVIDINRLTRGDISRCANLIDRYGLWGKNSRLSIDEKTELLKDRAHGASRFQSIMIEVMQSGDMARRIKETVETIKRDSKGYHNTVIIILCSQIMNLGLSTRDIERITNISISSDALFRANPAINELLAIEDGRNTFSIKSPVTAKLILQDVATAEMVIDALYTIACYSIKYKNIPKHQEVLNGIISFSHIVSLLKDPVNSKEFLAQYYDRLGELDYYRDRNFFWLQYAISCIEIGEYERAQKYLDNAYGSIEEGFEPFQINNQQAHLYLELIRTNNSSNILSDFTKAHRLLMVPIVSEKDNEYNVVKLFAYYVKKDVYSKLNTPELEAVHKASCKEAYNRLSVYIENNPTDGNELRDLLHNLLKLSY